MKEETKKKRNTAIFILVATILNVVLMVFFIIIGFVLLNRFGDPESDWNTLWIFLMFVGAVGFSWVIYHALIKLYMKHVDVEKKFAPVLAPRKRRIPKRDTSEDK